MNVTSCKSPHLVASRVRFVLTAIGETLDLLASAYPSTSAYIATRFPPNLHRPCNATVETFEGKPLAVRDAARVLRALTGVVPDRGRKLPKRTAVRILSRNERPLTEWFEVVGGDLWPLGLSVEDGLVTVTWAMTRATPR